MNELNRPLNLNVEHWDILAADHDDRSRDWQEKEPSTFIDSVNTPTNNTFDFVGDLKE